MSVECRCGHGLHSHGRTARLGLPHTHSDVEDRTCQACIHCGKGLLTHKPHMACPFQKCACKDWQRVGK